MIFFIIISFLVLLFLAALPFIGIIAAAFNAYYVYNFSNALKLKHPVVWTILSMLPIIGLVVLVIINQKATKLLRDARLRVGFFGCGKEELERFAQAKVYGKIQ